MSLPRARTPAHRVHHLDFFSTIGGVVGTMMGHNEWAWNDNSVRVLGSIELHAKPTFAAIWNVLLSVHSCSQRALVSTSKEISYKLYIV